MNRQLEAIGLLHLAPGSSEEAEMGERGQGVLLAEVHRKKNE